MARENAPVQNHGGSEKQIVLWKVKSPVLKELFSSLRRVLACCVGGGQAATGITVALKWTNRAAHAGATDVWELRFQVLQDVHPASVPAHVWSLLHIKGFSYICVSSANLLLQLLSEK